jgi:hypothetical protein
MSLVNENVMLFDLVSIIKDNKKRDGKTKLYETVQKMSSSEKEQLLVESVRTLEAALRSK